ncbi:helix-turn-helix domain-containing protein [Pedobacter sp. KLB.chiD]|uniref:helix-turn-helix domain-containing protein n=1 Tax=Pedobacter sp. KLB.chiD TaxID=3387402 RepID=UPI00399BFD2C
MTLGTKILRLRESTKMTREQVAIQIDVTKVAYGRWESDLCKPKMDNLVRLCLFYDLTFEELLKDVTNGSSLKDVDYSNKFLDCANSGFTKNQSTVEALIKNQDEILRLLLLQQRLLAGLYYIKA